MSHSSDGLSIENNILGDLAKICKSYAKEIYYLESEYF